MVQNAGLAGHYETRFHHFWRRNPPRLSKKAYDEYGANWRNKARDYKIVGGHGVPPELGLRSAIHRRVPQDIANKHRTLAPQDHQICRPKVKKNSASTSE